MLVAKCILVVVAMISVLLRCDCGLSESSARLQINCLNFAMYWLLVPMLLGGVATACTYLATHICSALNQCCLRIICLLMLGHLLAMLTGSCKQLNDLMFLHWVRGRLLVHHCRLIQSSQQKKWDLRAILQTHLTQCPIVILLQRRSLTLL